MTMRPDSSPNQVLIQTFPALDDEARILAMNLRARARDKFEREWNKVNQLYRDKKALGLSAVIATEVDDISKANMKTPEDISYVHSQTEKRRQELMMRIDKVPESL